MIVTDHFFHERDQYPKIHRLRKDTAHASLGCGSGRCCRSPTRDQWATAKTVKPDTVIRHSRADDAVPFAGRKELVKNSGLPEERAAIGRKRYRSIRWMAEGCQKLCRILS